MADPKDQFPKAYDPAAHEDAVYAAWQESGFFNPDKLPGKRKESFTTVMPPPNVTGILHLGHALENAMMDTMARFERMRGKKVLLVPGTDHAAIATQAKVEKMLMAKGMKNPRQELGREKMLEEIRAFAEGSKTIILSQIKKMGTSCDWSRLAYTFDDARNRSVNELFVRMYNDGLIYRGDRVVHWSVKGQSTCSDEEIEHEERPATLYTFKYAKDFPITIASTRPETKLGDTAVAVHPTDKRYKKFIGQTFTADVGAAEPLSITIIADESVDPDFGTGALGVTPAHSPVDFAIFEKQKAKGEPIALIPVIGMDGKMSAQAGTYAGLTVEAARAQFVDWLKEQGLLEKEEEITQNVGMSDRYGDVIESLPMTQWWLDMNKDIPKRGKSLRDLLREAVTTGLHGDESQKVKITPDRFTKLYLDRVDNLRDWCLSRQLWWGHRIPVWYRGEEMHVGVDAPSGEGWAQDQDTLDTWFSSGSWTFSTLGWPDKKNDLKQFHPTDWIQMGYEILYLWLMRMILMSAYALDEVPFNDAYIHGMLRDKDGKKFSKSSGNGIDPIEVIGQYGCDALRVSLLMGNTPGNDSRYYTEKIEGGRNFVNKLWNIGRFVLTTTEGKVPAKAPKGVTLADRWILSRLSTTIEKVTAHLARYEFSLAGELLRDFTWGDFADWYIEIAKTQKKDADPAKTDAVLRYVLDRVLRLWHPFMPFVTEVVWKQMHGGVGAIHELPLLVSDWPEAAQGPDQTIEQQMQRIQEVVVAIRNVRSEHHISPKQTLKLTIAASGDATLLEKNGQVIADLVRAEAIHFEDREKQDGEIVAVSGSVQIFVAHQGSVGDSTKLSARADELTRYIASIDAKLANEEFTSKAPPAVIEKEKGKRAAAAEELDKIRKQLEG